MFKSVFSLGIFGFMFAVFASGECPIQSGDKVAFLGDSITQAGWNNPYGYVKLVIAGLETMDIKVEAIPAGVGGHMSSDMLARLERDVLDKTPTWMTLSCGVDDVWRGERGVAIEDYTKNITEIVDKALAANIKVMILTSTMISEDPEAPNNQKLAEYNAVLRELAKEKNCLLADLNADMHTALEEIKKTDSTSGNKLTSDGVHMLFPGDKVMATGILRVLGADDAQMQKINDVWDNIPGTITVTLRLSNAEFNELKKAASAKETTPEKFLRSTF